MKIKKANNFFSKHCIVSFENLKPSLSYILYQCYNYINMTSEQSNRKVYGCHNCSYFPIQTFGK